MEQRPQGLRNGREPSQGNRTTIWRTLDHGSRNVGPWNNDINDHIVITTTANYLERHRSRGHTSRDLRISDTSSRLCAIQMVWLGFYDALTQVPAPWDHFTRVSRIYDDLTWLLKSLNGPSRVLCLLTTNLLIFFFENFSDTSDETDVRLCIKFT